MHVSRLSRGITEQRQAEIERERQNEQAWLLERHLPQSEEISCIVCGCTENNACNLGGYPCSWVAPGLCSNPQCVAAFEAGQIPAECGSLVELP